MGDIERAADTGQHGHEASRESQSKRVKALRACCLSENHCMGVGVAEGSEPARK